MVPLSSVVDIIGGGTPKTTVNEYWGGNMPWLSVVDFGNDNRHVFNTEKSITEAGLKNSSTKVLDRGDIIISARGTVGEIAQLGRPMAFNQSCYGLKAKPDISNDFLYYLLKQLASNFKQKAHGAVFDTITRDTFKNIYVNIPPKHEQHQIAEILSSLDDKIELNRQINANLEAIAGALFKRWFVDIGDKLPGGWRVSTIGKELETFLGGTPSREKSEYWINGDNAWINSGKTNDFRITKPSEYITDEAIKNSAAKLLPKGTVVLAITGATLGQYSLLEIDSSFNQSVVGIKENEKFKKEFIYFYIAHNIQNLISAQTGGAQQHINKQTVDNYTILVPDENSLKSYYDISSPIFEMISKNCFEIDNFSNTRDVLLPKLMSGKILL